MPIDSAPRFTLNQWAQLNGPPTRVRTCQNITPANTHTGGNKFLIIVNKYIHNGTYILIRWGYINPLNRKISAQNTSRHRMGLTLRRW